MILHKFLKNGPIFVSKYFKIKPQTLPAICSMISSENVVLKKYKMDGPAELKSIVAESNNDQNIILNRFIDLKHEQFMEKVSDFLPLCKKISHHFDTKVDIVPVGKHAAMLNLDKEIDFGLVLYHISQFEKINLLKKFIKKKIY
jgi:hypothetical protein